VGLLLLLTRMLCCAVHCNSHSAVWLHKAFVGCKRRGHRHDQWGCTLQARNTSRCLGAVHICPPGMTVNSRNNRSVAKLFELLLPISPPLLHACRC
jgi:hypothetical protein